GKERLDIERLEPSDVTLLEEEIDTMNEALPPMTHFVLPGGHQTVSFCHITRCVCRRAERLATALHDISPIDSLVLIYLNRLSDYFFVLARKLTLDLRANEVAWIPKKKS
ncbi:MAG: ATP:cob(I)alamin adenosyltransferase, partial [Mangrovimonas sp.]|nr:ATP:cob(I)alamin adenosyltransferase [Mangrovimonas sp.]HPF97266.1 ATP:cob(I)alamin adenosyltransferase [Mangrovimonas sp.]